jgi:hypothetical protein
MYLGNPMLPVSLPVNEALQKITKILEEKNWQNFEIGSMKLVLTPFFFYQYYYFLEEEKSNSKIVTQTVDGYISLNANSLKIDEAISKLIKNKSREQDNVAPQIEFSELESNLSKKQEEKVLTVKTAQFFSVPKENMGISNVRQVLVPFYETQITIMSQTYSIVINAIDGDLKGVEKIPIREKGFLEITRETLDELTSPTTWVTYTKELFLDASSAMVSSKVVEKEKKEAFKPLNLSFLESRWVLILIMLLALLLIYLSFL